jgi:hypothetical protein
VTGCHAFSIFRRYHELRNRVASRRKLQVFGTGFAISFIQAAKFILTKGEVVQEELAAFCVRA